MQTGASWLGLCTGKKERLQHVCLSACFKCYIWYSPCLSVCPSFSNGTFEDRHVSLSVRLFQTAHLRFVMVVCLSVCFKQHIWGRHVCLSVCFKRQIWGPACLSVLLFQRTYLRFGMSVCPSVSKGASDFRNVCLSVRLFQTAYLSFVMLVCLSVCFKRHNWGSSCSSVCPSLSNGTSEVRHCCLSVRLFQRHIWCSACLSVYLSVCF